MAKRKGSEGPDPNEWSALRSFANGLYEEMDKLARKAPSSTLSDLAFKRVNRAISEAKKLMGPHDQYAAELSEFVPAGENPEVRDAVLVLREIKQALKRIDDTFELERQLRGY